MYKTQYIEPKNSVNNRDKGNYNLNIQLDSNSFLLPKKKPNKKLTK